MTKRIVNLRLSEEMIDLVNQQIGDNFTQKFENLVTRCMWELPAAEARLKAVEDMIDNKRKELQKLSEEYRKYQNIVGNIAYYLGDL